MVQILRIPLFVLVLALASCMPPESRAKQMGARLREWVPERTPMASAQQIMQSQGFTCSITSFASLEQMTNRNEALLDGPLWKVLLKRNDTREAVTNLSYLDCQRTTNGHTCNVRFILLNGQTQGYRAFGCL
jgi:hypothetical protein